MQASREGAAAQRFAARGILGSDLLRELGDEVFDFGLHARAPGMAGPARELHGTLSKSSCVRAAISVIATHVIFPKASSEEGSFAGGPGAAHRVRSEKEIWMTAWITAALVGVSLAGAAHADADAPHLVVAGHGSSLEEALAQPHAPNYRLLVLREQLLRLRASPAEEDVRLLLKRARRDGAVVFVCERDLRTERLERSDLVPGVVSVASAVWENGAPTKADLALRSLCS